LTVEKYSDKTILIGLKNRKDIILEYLYKEYFPQIKRIVLTNGGNEQDARDLFQEALIIVFNRLQKNKLVIKSSFHNFFIVLCKFIWFRQNNINHKYSIEGTGEESPQGINAQPALNEIPGESLYKEHLASQYEKIYQRQYRKLPGDCKRVLKMFFRKKSFKEIAVRMGYSNEDYARRKKYLSMQQLMKMINLDPEYKLLKQSCRD
jgi:RNA polymerase sigma factor (sigma-70 family)